MMYVNYQFLHSRMFYIDYKNFIIFFPSYENVLGRRYDLIDTQIRIHHCALLARRTRTTTTVKQYDKFSLNFRDLYHLSIAT